MSKVKVTLIKSLIGRPEEQRATARALGLGKSNSSVIKEENPAITGMIKKIAHLVSVEEA
ncbi:MAG: 50S ribosomal protein L30 [Peptococcaceae bacterium]|jgi:large subunit ribosomal protein L30|nr:50S ribosomal protein L30 [Peptococcaceae bacterium]